MNVVTVAQISASLPGDFGSRPWWAGSRPWWAGVLPRCRAALLDVLDVLGAAARCLAGFYLLIGQLLYLLAGRYLPPFDPAWHQSARSRSAGPDRRDQGRSSTGQSGQGPRPTGRPADRQGGAASGEPHSGAAEPGGKQPERPASEPPPAGHAGGQGGTGQAPESPSGRPAADRATVTGYAAGQRADDDAPDDDVDEDQPDVADDEEEEEDEAGAPSPAPRLIAVTGAGGPAGIAVIRALRTAGERVLALDADPGAAGLHLANLRAVLPRADSTGYGDALLRVVEDYHPLALICTVAEEFPPLRLVALRLTELGCRTWLPPPAATDTCLDKGAFAATMLLHGIPHPPTALSPEAASVLPGPWIIKPAQGRGSRRVVFADTEDELGRALAMVAAPLAQTRVAGREFTADVLLDRDGSLLTCVPRWRDMTRGGISVRGVTFDSTTVTRTVAAALTAVGLTGPANVQGFVADPGALDGDPDAPVRVTLVEVNPRFSGGLPLTLAAGADVVGTYLTGVLDPSAALPRLTFRPGVHMSRYFAEVYYTAGGAPVADPLARSGEPE